MKTEVPKTYRSGFTLSELELRRISQGYQEHMSKQVKPENVQVHLATTLVDGTVIDTSIIDDILALENEGSKRIKRLSLCFCDDKDPSDYKISLMFQNADRDPRSWVSIDLEVLGQSRDWAFLAAAEIDERLKKVKQLSSSFVVGSRWFAILPLIISFMITMLFVFPLLSPPLR